VERAPRKAPFLFEFGARVAIIFIAQMPAHRTTGALSAGLALKRQMSAIGQ
jgi:hypothetical protein